MKRLTEVSEVDKSPKAELASPEIAFFRRGDWCLVVKKTAFTRSRGKTDGPVKVRNEGGQGREAAVLVNC